MATAPRKNSAKAGRKKAAKKQVTSKKKPTAKPARKSSSNAEKSVLARAAAAQRETGSRKFLPEDMDAYIQKLLNADLVKQGDRNLTFELLKRYFDPQVYGTANLDTSRPTIYVANHCIFGVDGGMAPSIILEATGRLPRLLTDSATMMGSMEEQLIRGGQILADEQVCDAMMEAGHDLMVFPGGAREGAKLRRQLYELMWEGRTGFVKMAVKHGYTITPFCTIGPDDMWDVVWDREDVVGSRVGNLLEKLVPDLWDAENFPPIPRGLGLTPIPRPERFYLNFGEPYDTAPLKGKASAAKLTRIKNTVQQRVQDLISETLLIRTRSRASMGLLRRLLTRN